MPHKQPKRGRLWFNDGSCVRLRPQYPGHVWSYDFVMDRTHDGKAFRMLTVIDEHSRQCLAIHVQRKLKSDEVLAVLTELFQRQDPPDHIRCDNPVLSLSKGALSLPHMSYATGALGSA